MGDGRAEIVERARQVWIKRLIDLSRRNNLLYFRPLKSGTLPLDHDGGEAWTSLLSGKSVSLDSFVTEERGAPLASKVQEITRRALTNAEEKGLKTLFVALGMASWKIDDEGRPPQAPVLLLPVAVEGHGRERRSFSLRSDGPLQVNLVLLHVLDGSFGLKLTEDEIFQGNGHHDEDHPFAPQPVYERLCQLAREVPEFAIAPQAVLGNFAFQKMAMVRDLQSCGPQLVQSDLIAAIAGDTGARTGVGKSEFKLDPQELDRNLPQNEFQILDADSSQQCAMAAALAGQSTVIHGPPGTGKSQTIANLIASFAAQGKHVLFVAEKRAALEAVFKRLEQVGIGHLAMDLHGADVSSRLVMEQIARNLDLIRHSGEVDCEALHQRYVLDRDRLNTHVARLHQKRPPSGQSVYGLQGQLLRLRPEYETGIRWRDAALQRIGLKEAEKIRDLLVEAGAFELLFLGNSPSPWNGAVLPDEGSAQRSIDAAIQLAGGRWSDYRAAVTRVARAAKLAEPKTIGEANALFDLLAQVQQTPSHFLPEIWKQNLRQLLKDLLPATQGFFGAAWAWLTSGAFRDARKLARGLRLPPAISTAVICGELDQVAAQKEEWQKWAAPGGLPFVPPEYEACLKPFTEGSARLRILSGFLSADQLEKKPLDDVGSLLERLRSDTDTPHQIPKVLSLSKQLESAGAGELASDLRAKKQDAKKWPQIFQFAWLASCMDLARMGDPEIGGFNGRSHDQFVDEFRRLDRERIEIAAARVRRAHGQRAIEAMNQHPDQEQLVRRESEKKTRHIPLRKLVARAPEVLTALCPCWMASPLSVSQLLEGDKRYFDVVIFDEASQILPEDSVPAILRGAQVVVAGDTCQLPPTTFFTAGSDDEPDDETQEIGTEGFESLLDLTNSFLPSKYLDWHYRSRDEALISFSNHHIYKDRLVTFPGIGGPPVIEHILVEQKSGRDGQEESSDEEIRKVVELVLEHARGKPDSSLGLITMGIRHRDRVQRALDEAVEGNHAELQAFFDPHRPERFFVKNLERVQGDERDSIILTIGYGKDRGGNLPFRFGPLLSAGGRRRLNVAITRARQEITVVSSFSSADMDPARITPGSGVELLRDYLLYAASRGKRWAQAASTSYPLNDFESAVYDGLSAQGVPLESQVGASGYRIDFAAKHPSKPGRFVLAIECDGATYHSSPTARDRDRLRQQQLENLGWRFHRIWSTDWFTRREEEVQRAVKAFHAAVEFADQLDAGRAVRAPDANGDTNHTAVSADSLAQNGLNSRRRSRRPLIGHRESIDDYSPNELVSMVNWIISDGELRTDEQIIHEMIAELGFARRGPRIEAALEQAVSAARHSAPAPGDKT